MTSRPRTDGKLPLTELADMKSRREPIVIVTAYDYPSGRIADVAGIDVVLVGDSAAMTVLGNESTVPATMDEMLMLTRAAARGAPGRARGRLRPGDGGDRIGTGARAGAASRALARARRLAVQAARRRACPQ